MHPCNTVSAAICIRAQICLSLTTLKKLGDEVILYTNFKSKSDDLKGILAINRSCIMHGVRPLDKRGINAGGGLVIYVDAGYADLVERRE